MASLAHILNGDVGLSVRTKLNSLIDQYNVPAGFPSGGGTPGSVLFLDASGNMTQDNAHFFWDDSADNLKLLGSLTTLAAVFDGATSGSVTVEAQAVAGSWTMKLPVSAGTNLYVLQTDGTGVTSWVPQSGGGGGMAIGGAVTGGTTGSVLFVDGAADLAQDNAHFFWDNTNKYLKIGTPGTPGAYYLNSVPAIFEVANGSGNNWFEGNAGNVTLTGSSNFGTGDGALAALTSGNENVAIGTDALQNLQSGPNNLGLGFSALNSTVLDGNNVAIGAFCFNDLGLGGAGASNNGNNVGMGFACMYNVQIGYDNVVIGAAGLINVFPPMTAVNNTIIGADAGKNLGSGGGATVSYNLMIGSSIGKNLTGASSYNTWLGGYLGPSAALSNTIVISGGNAYSIFDWDVTAVGVWSFSSSPSLFGPTALHVYNAQDQLGAAMTIYERGIFAWNIVANVLLIGTQFSGAGTAARNMEFIIGGVNKLDYGITNAGLWTFAQATMFATSTTLTNGAAASLGTLTNAPAAGNPTKWIPINDNGTTRYIPAW